MTVPRTAPPALAAIDMGSNSFRLEIAQLNRSNYRRQEYLKETVRLGAGLDANGELTEAAMQRGLDCLARFAQRLQGFEPGRVRAVATQTLREARNRNSFLARAQAVLGHPIEVISGREEARLIFAGVARLQPSQTPRLVIDIGGRSTEMILGHGRVPLKAESFQVGSVSLSMRFFPEGRFSAEAFRAAQVAAGAELEEALSQFSRPLAQPAWVEALGSSGTVGAVAQILAATGVTDGSITPEALRWCIEQCIAVGHMDKLKLPGLKEDRRAVVGGGLCILYTLLTQFGIERLQPAKGALRQGVIFDLAERLEAAQLAQGRDMRDQSVAELQRRFGVDREQAGRVQDLALALYKQLQPRAPRELQRELGWAAALHELGMMVSHHDHHRHTAYLLAHVDASGFSQNQLKRLGDLALGQRGGLRKLEPQLGDETLLWQVLALRLAVIHAHARGAIAEGSMRLQRQGRRVRVQLDRDWAAAQPRAFYLMQEELQAWSKLELVELTLQA
ncbi:Ppx/GppA phosphatase family protein [Paucibacter sediminis]|uniref:Ppx/GppA phosphatase family protein n=1 Tax=Paucibacter sediminis TaxID=3019553 RepID=A0AA95NA23_9BURK|nr:Ppx/GppA phosphatase family protein [Paucibacter sp. S2-9]WIT10210.1 Ppx/GppA phosphatase family protein [Paucibacter sp. S2-9]